MASIQVRNRLRRPEPVRGAVLQLTQSGSTPRSVTATTDQAGNATLTTTGLPDGVYSLTVTPAQTSAGAVGPLTAAGSASDRIFRSLQAQVTLTAGAVTAASIPFIQSANGTITFARNAPTVVTLQPVWMRSKNHGARGQAITGIIIHHTGGPTIGGAIEEFLNQTASAHYVIDTDGQIVKMVQDAERANHAGEARWDRDAHVNSRTIGIEIVNRTGKYPPVQMNAVIDLLGRLRTAFPTIVPWNVIGHSDVATNPSGRLGRKSGDPGLEFEWARVEALGLGMFQSPVPIVPTLYAGFFVGFPTESFRAGDNDAKRRFGGAARSTVFGNPIRELQTDLDLIGYSVGTPDGDFGQKTHMAVLMFQEHFFAGGRGHKRPDGRVDRQTATMIKSAVIGKAASLVIMTPGAAGAGGGRP